MTKPSMSILLVDDDPHVRTIFELVMNHHKLPLTVMSNAEDAIEYLQAHTPDIIVLDLFMPGIDGYQALDRIRETALEPMCSVVATTAYYTNDTRQEVLQRGFNGFLPKPIDGESVVRYLQVIADQDS